MKRCTFDIPGAARGTFFRVRQESSNRVTLTYKSKQSLSIDGMQELEIEVSDFETALHMVKLMGLKQATYEENYREKFLYNGAEVTIDEWPAIPPIVEIEGDAENTVSEVVTSLGFDIKDGVFGNIDEMYAKHGLNIKGLNVITFQNPPQKM